MRRPHQRQDILALALRRFLIDHLTQQKAFSPHTILSYRDSLKLLLNHIVGGTRMHVAELELADVTPTRVLAFLDYAERQRGNVASTRNVRLAAVHSFFRYVAAGWPQHIEQAQRILAIPFKRTARRQIDYLESDEVHAVLSQIDVSTSLGCRDHALLTLMINTGARVQEIVALKRGDFHLGPGASVRLYGKGRKERLCPIWRETVSTIRRLMKHDGDNPADLPLFRNHHGGPLTRFGARLILQKYVRRAASNQPKLLRKRIHPHSIRHSTAVHLLHSGVDLSTIAHWLGHSSVNTTHKYLEFNLQAKREALAKAQPITGTRHRKTKWRADGDLLAWLEAL